jgi:SAM-dependent methyltransferase
MVNPSSTERVVREAVTGAERFREAEAYAGHHANPHLETRTELLLSLLPADVTRVLDVGCGPGVAGHAMESAGRTVYSLDASMAALRAGPPRPVCASATALPFPDGAFDASVSFELLEHLPREAVTDAAREIARVARRWIIFGVPHRENLKRNHLRCPDCGHEFNRSGHLNQFDADAIARLFPGWRARTTHICGPAVRDYPAPLLWTRHHIAKSYSEMGGGHGVRCPECGQDQFPAFRYNPLSWMLDATNKLISRRRPYWIIQLLERA